MLSKFYKALNSIKYTVIHPQWVANTWHLKKFNLISTYRKQGICIDIGSGNDSIVKHFDSATQNFIKFDYPKTSQRYGSKPDIYADIQQFPVKTNSVDTVIFFEVIEHVPDDELAIMEISRVLKGSGILFMSAPFLYPLHDEPYDFRRYTIHGLVNLLKKNDFEIVETIQHGNSITTVLQLINLSLLDTVKSMSQNSMLLGLCIIPPVTIACLLSNFISLITFKLKSPSALLLGYTIVAKRIGK